MNKNNCGDGLRWQVCPWLGYSVERQRQRAVRQQHKRGGSGPGNRTGCNRAPSVERIGWARNCDRTRERSSTDKATQKLHRQPLRILSTRHESYRDTGGKKGTIIRWRRKIGGRKDNYFIYLLLLLLLFIIYYCYYFLLLLLLLLFMKIIITCST